MIRFIFIATIIALSGCASAPDFSRWTHPTKDSSEWKSELAECERFFGGGDAEKSRCMTAKGWRASKR